MSSGKSPPGSGAAVLAALGGAPQRYTENYARYRQYGGLLRPEELVPGFTAGGLNRGDMARFYFFCLAFDQIVRECLPGDFLELGAYRGNTASVLAEMARKLDRTAYVLDTFEGFHPADLRGIDASADPQQFGDTSLEAVRALVGERNVRFVRGRFPETASQLPADGRYSFVHIDCDLYAPIRSALDYFYPRVVPGGFIVIHDYSSLCWAGAEQAVDEFFADKPEAPTPLPDGAGSVVVRKAKAAGPSGNWLLRKRAALLQPEWISAANGGLRDLLGEGWSQPEEWGVWGVGPEHEMHLVLPSADPGLFDLELDVHAALLATRTEQRVEIWANGGRSGVWEFTTAANRGVRRLRLQTKFPPGAPDPLVQFTVLFKPAATESPRRLSPDLNDDRPLGMALHRLRFLPVR